MFPDESSATPEGPLSSASVAVPVTPFATSPEYPAVPLPAIVLMVPPEISRMRWFTESALYRLPDESKAIPSGELSWALVGAPVSPEKPAVPLPAMVLTVYCWPQAQVETTHTARGKKNCRIVIGRIHTTRRRPVSSVRYR